MSGKKRIVSLIAAIIILLGLIFTFSNMNSYQTNSKSKHIIKLVVTKVNPNLSEDDANKLVKKLNFPFRKLMHFSEYLVLTALIIYLLKYLNLSKKDIVIAALLICFSLATFDEIHQLLIGRTGRFLDVFIDTLGGLVSCLIYKFKK